MLNWSPSRLNSFSFARRVLRSFSQTSRDTTLGYSVLLVLIVDGFSLFSQLHDEPAPIFRTSFATSFSQRSNRKISIRTLAAQKKLRLYRSAARRTSV